MRDLYGEEFLDAHIYKTFVRETPSYVRDTKHFLQMLRYLGRLPEGTILVTADVVGLYSHIPHEEGLQALREALTNSPDDLARLALTNNNLSLVENITYNSGEMLSVLKRLLRMQTFSWGRWNRDYWNNPLATKPLFWRRFKGLGSLWNV